MREKLLFLIPALLLIRVGTDAQAPATAAEKINSVFAEVTQKDAPGLAALVRKDGKTVFEMGYGVRDLRTMARIDGRTNFRLASFTKQFTAMAIMLLVHDGKLRYDDKLTRIFPEFPSYGKDITIRNLLNHTSGLPDYEDLMDTREIGKGPILTSEHQIQDEEVLQLLEKESKGFFAPGTSWAYSNSGYVVLGLIVTKVSRKPFGDFLAERIFAPLHMDRTLMFVKGKNEVTDRAYGHTKEKETGIFKETDQSPTSATQGDGGIYTSLEDLAKWDDALRNHTLLSAEEMKPALTEAKLMDGSITRTPDPPMVTTAPRENPSPTVSAGSWILTKDTRACGIQAERWDSEPSSRDSPGTRTNSPSSSSATAPTSIQKSLP